MKRWLKIILFIVLGLGSFLLALVGPIDRTPLADQDFYRSMRLAFDTLQLTNHPPSQSLQASWGKISITPDHNMPMAGYRIRPRFEAVHDSLQARVIHIHNGAAAVYLISVDLLLFPPALKEKLHQAAKVELNDPILFLSATHTHNGVGGWHESAAGEAILGQYDSSWVNQVSADLLTLMKQLKDKLGPATLSHWQTDAQEYVENRLVRDAPKDGLLRGLLIHKHDGATARLITFSAHPTNISKHINLLSGDYPAALIKTLEEHGTFGLFMAGMVGSHRLTGINDVDFEVTTYAGRVLADKIRLSSSVAQPDLLEIKSSQIPIQLGPAQLRIASNLKLRNWVFARLLHPLQGELTYLQLGTVVLIGTPCDFSGELYITQKLDSLSEAHGKNLIVTSFNGDYIGYITEDSHYDEVDKEEVRAMNWVGPYYGSYFADMIGILIKK